MSENQQPAPVRRPRFVYVPAIGPKLRPLLWIVLLGFGLLGGNGLYLLSVTVLTWWTKTTQQTPFYMLMVAVHLFLGLLLIVPFIVFGLAHLATSWKRPNKSAIWRGLWLLGVGIVVLVSGLVLVRLEGFEIRDNRIRDVGYWSHIVAPLLAIGLYVSHRRAGPRIKWAYLRTWGSVVAAMVVVMGVLHTADPSNYAVKGPREGKKYFFPSEAVTATGAFIPEKTLMMDSYCQKCHQDAYKGWFHSSHHFSSFNNEAYLASVKETREVGTKRDGDVRAARWCAGCHDPVPFFSGKFDDPNFDMVKDPTAHAGITCTVCHSMTNIGSTRGNGDYTIENPKHYPFAFSENPLLQWVNNTLIKAKPEMHKRTFLKPEVHQKAEFCSTCHKVGLPYGLNHYKDFVRGQNHWDTYLLSGVSGHGARSFYYPPVAKTSCVECHMTLIPSNDFGAKTTFDNSGERKIHDHLFLGANTALPTFRGDTEIAKKHEKFLQNGITRIDIFGIKADGRIDSPLIAPLRPETPELKPGGKYLVEVVVRTTGVGHPLTQGTVDSNEIWVELAASQGGKIVGQSGGIDESGTVDPTSHFINVYMLDRTGKRIDRRNPQDIFVPLYNKQVPPGAGQVVHFELEVPAGVTAPIELEAKLNYRKFDRKYMDYVFGKGQNKGGPLPVVVMAKDAVKLPVAGGEKVTNPPSPIKDGWQRWNDYGIGLFLEGAEKGGQKGELKQAEEAFRKVADLGFVDGWVNLARVYQREGRIPDALEALTKASKHEKPAAPWVITWLTGQINVRNGFLDEAIEAFSAVLSTKIPERKFDFSMDYEVINALGSAYELRARQERAGTPGRVEYLEKAIDAYSRTLALDTENLMAHYGLGLSYGELSRGREVKSEAPAEAVTAEKILELAGELAQAKEGSATALRADTLNKAIEAFLAGPRPEFGSRLEPMHTVIEKATPLWRQSADPDNRQALAALLARTHKALHEMYKPDETAEGIAIATARKENPAADLNSQSIVIHPMHPPKVKAAEKHDAGTQESAKTIKTTEISADSLRQIESMKQMIISSGEKAGGSE
ncbi:MAG: multiheme c-type cytochrome [bacterium]